MENLQQNVRPDDLWRRYIVLPEKASARLAGILNSSESVRRNDSEIAAYTMPFKHAPAQSKLIVAMRPLKQVSPAAYDLLAAVLMRVSLDTLFMRVEQRQFHPKDLKHPFMVEYVRRQLLKLVLPKRHGANGPRRHSEVVADVRSRYPELQDQTGAFCVLCVVLEWWITAVKIDAQGKVKHPSTSALETKLESLRFCKSEIKAICKILRWQSRDPQPSIT